MDECGAQSIHVIPYNTPENSLLSHNANIDRTELFEVKW